MDNDSLIRMYQGKEPKWKDPSATQKPQPQIKLQPKEAESSYKKSDPERDSLLSAFNEKYGVLKLQGKDYDNQMALFKERWEADKEKRKIRPTPGSPLERMAREEAYGKTNSRKREQGEDMKPDSDQSPEARARRVDALSKSLAKLK